MPFKKQLCQACNLPAWKPSSECTRSVYMFEIFLLLGYL